ncbi:MAG: alpha-E domain-containing protein [Cyclobacteriaceae bacterium]
MLSRVADSLYWMSRYVERTDSIVRVLRTNYYSSQDEPGQFSWKPVLKTFSQLPDTDIAAMEYNGRKVLHYMVFDRDNPNAVLNMVMRSRENARAVQDNITKEVWQSLNEFYHIIRDEQLERALRTEDPVTVLDTIGRQTMYYYGVCDISMFRGEGLCFMNIGKYLERASQSAGFLDVKFNDLSYDMNKVSDSSYWKYLLLSLSGYSLYLKRYRSGFEARNIVDQVLFNTDFPKSVLYSINQLQRYFQRLRSDQNIQGFSETDFLIGRLRSKIQYATVESVSSVGLHNYLTDITNDLYAVGNKLNQYYFAYS